VVRGWILKPNKEDTPIDWRNIREEVQQEYEDRNKDKCFVIECDEKAVTTRSILRSSHIDLCNIHSRDENVNMDMRKFISFGLGKYIETQS
jgi:hypothetical protein